MIIHIRGANGSGKSTVIREFMGWYSNNTPWVAEHKEKRKRPYYYTCGKVAVLGHYEIDCGGCDTISGNKELFELQEALCKTRHVIAEGIMLSEDVKWTSQLIPIVGDGCVKTIFLNTDLETCLERVKHRREGSTRNHAEPFDPTRTIRRYNDLDRVRQRILRDCPQIDCRLRSPEQALKLLKKWTSE